MKLDYLIVKKVNHKKSQYGIVSIRDNICYLQPQIKGHWAEPLLEKAGLLCLVTVYILLKVQLIGIIIWLEFYSKKNCNANNVGPAHATMVLCLCMK